MTHVTRASIAYVATQVLWLSLQFVEQRLIPRSFGSAYRLRLYSRDLTQPRTRSDFIPASWICWMIPRKQKRSTTCSSGGIGECLMRRYNSFVYQRNSRIFPNHLRVPFAPTGNNVLAKIRAKRASLNAAKNAVPASTPFSRMPSHGVPP